MEDLLIFTVAITILNPNFHVFACQEATKDIFVFNTIDVYDYWEKEFEESIDKSGELPDPDETTGFYDAIELSDTLI